MALHMNLGLNSFTKHRNGVHSPPRRNPEKARSQPDSRWASQIGLCAITLAMAFLFTACGRPAQTPVTVSSGSDWREFQGTWTAAGSRYILPLSGDRRASISHFTGSLMLAGASRPDIGFRAEAIVFNDSVTGMVGRAVWTDEHSDQVFSELRGEGTTTTNRIVGTFLGGTGPYADATGSYEFSWRFLLETEDGTPQGQSVGLHGRVRMTQRAIAPGTGGSRR